MHHKPIKYVQRFVLCLGLSGTLTGIHAQENKQAANVSTAPLMLYFHFDNATIDSTYMDNSHALRHLDKQFSNRTLAAHIDSVNIFSFASPEGNRTYNERLARQRSISVKNYLGAKYPHIDTCRLHSYPKGENWQELRRLIAEDKNLPCREEVLQIIDHNRTPEQCKALLKRLNAGIPYQYIRKQYLRYLRNAAICVVWMRPDIPSALSDTVPLGYQQMEALAAAPQSNIRTAEKMRGTYTAVSATIDRFSSIPKRPLFALKTNLLFDAALMPNIEFEVPIGKRWSVNGEYVFPWWLLDNDKYCMQLLMGGLEGRYWLGSRKKREQKEVLTGHFLGLYAGGGKYDLQWEENGYQGEFFIAAGVSYGWATRIARNLHLEFNIGIGLLRTDYRHYHARDNYQTLLWQENGKYTWFGPTKAKISLVWLLNRKAKTTKGGVK